MLLSPLVHAAGAPSSFVSRADIFASHRPAVMNRTLHCQCGHLCCVRVHVGKPLQSPFFLHTPHTVFHCLNKHRIACSVILQATSLLQPLTGSWRSISLNEHEEAFAIISDQACDDMVLTLVLQSLTSLWLMKLLLSTKWQGWNLCCSSASNFRMKCFSVACDPNKGDWPQTLKKEENILAANDAPNRKHCVRACE